MQNSLAASPHQILFRPPYPPSYIPYGHYFNPYFLPPMHQFLSHNGLSQQLSTGNTFLTPAPGMKFPLPQFKPGTSTGNPAPIGIQPLYGAYASSPIGFNPASGVTSGCSDCNNDLSTSQLKESQNYTTGPLVGFASHLTFKMVFLLLAFSIGFIIFNPAIYDTTKIKIFFWVLLSCTSICQG